MNPNRKTLFGYRDLLKELVSRDLKLKYRRSFLGYVWSVLNPLMIMVIMYIVFSNIFRWNIPYYPVYLISGQMMFNFFSASTTQSIYSITDNASLLKKTYVPKYIFTLSKVTSGMLDFLFSLGAMFLVIIFTKTPFHWSMLAIPLVAAQLYLFCLGVGLFMSAANVFFRDIQYIYSAPLLLCDPVPRRDHLRTSAGLPAAPDGDRILRPGSGSRQLHLLQNTGQVHPLHLKRGGKMEDYMIDVDHVTVRFNKASENIDNLKEYFIKLIKHQLMFEEFLAVKDVSLKVKRGEAWGLLGTNGSGKSTMLKLISGILKPYKGTVKVAGTIAPLIELGAGLDMNLTARENIYLDGTLLGHSRKFMEDHFNEIVDFAELWDFLDMPVKNYSSGMQARIGFAIATIVRPDILIVDEILAVGDMHFQHKCMDRMNEMLSGGTTLLFVSHNIDDVRRMCDHALWIEKGNAVMSGQVNEVCDAYFQSQQE